MQDVGVITASYRYSRYLTYSHLACASLFLWEHVLTSRYEFELIWKAKWGLGKALFLLARYLVWPQLVATLLVDFSFPDAHHCHIVFVIFSDYWAVLIAAIASVILVLRTWALWESKRCVLIGLLVALCGALVPIIYIHVQTVSDVQYVPYTTYSAHLRLPGCTLTSSRRKEWVTFIIASCFDLLILCMTVTKAAKIGLRGVSGLISVLYRDGIVYFACMFAVSISNLGLIAVAPIEYIGLLRILQGVARSILACRIILHLREASSVADTDDLRTYSHAWNWGEGEG
ncbi:hypothetical protein EXIGLDRAFT_175147 [Exidia glandulosa HHB12029]|uniref:DUF6533 domain-containing protein n=1 Tax=Exidia glandulosa HHB12029 TaxID=1314781 RepID=A0A165F5G8_EXIGL|nr:hypothetical protein EXIGLDRAFT_175147 [Exidia glandulosa HHB12029]